MLAAARRPRLAVAARLGSAVRLGLVPPHSVARPCLCFAANVSRPLCCAALPGACAATWGRPAACQPSQLALRAATSPIELAVPPPVSFVVRSPLDALRLLARALWLGLIFLRPLLLLLPAAALPGHFRRALELELMHALERGGPCLIKLGQWASTRPDVLPLSLCRTLASLHDDSPTHGPGHTEAAIEEAFGAAATALFSSVERRPIGSGCIAQVHEGVTADGVRVAIKECLRRRPRPPVLQRATRQTCREPPPAARPEALARVPVSKSARLQLPAPPPVAAPDAAPQPGRRGDRHTQARAFTRCSPPRRQGRRRPRSVPDACIHRCSTPASRPPSPSTCT